MRTKTLQRIALVLVAFTVLALLGSTQPIQIGAFLLGILPSFIPSSILLVLTAALTWLGLKILGPNKLLLIAFVALLSFQSAILFCWVEAWTATSAYYDRSVKSGSLVIDPAFEDVAMVAFWLLAAFVAALIIEQLFRHAIVNFPGKHLPKRSVALVVLGEGLALLSLYSNHINHDRMPGKVIAQHSSSSNGKRQIQLIPVDRWLDTNGLIIAKEADALMWRRIGKIGDILTEADAAWFQWSEDGTKVCLKLNVSQYKGYAVWAYDLQMGQTINPKEEVEFR